MGQGEGFNRGVAIARGRLISLIDSDDLWFPQKLATVVRDFGDGNTVALHQHNLQLLRQGRVTEEPFRATLAVGDGYAVTSSTGS